MELITPSIPLADMLLACDSVAKPGGALNSIHSPVTGAKVHFGDLCAKMFAYGFLLLRKEGAVELELTEKNVFFVKTHAATVHKKRDTTTLPGPCPALLSAAIDGKSARDAVYATFDRDYRNPWGQVASAAADQLTTAGLFQTVKGGLGAKLGEMTTGLPKMEAVPGKEEEIQSRIATCAQKWNDFAKAEPQLCEQLVKDCYNGIQSRTEQRDPGDYYDR